MVRLPGAVPGPGARVPPGETPAASMVATPVAPTPVVSPVPRVNWTIGAATYPDPPVLTATDPTPLPAGGASRFWATVRLFPLVSIVPPSDQTYALVNPCMNV